MIMTTTFNVDGYTISEYLEIIIGEYQVKPPTGLGAAFSTGLSNLPGAGSSSSIGNTSVMRDIEKRAEKLGADAVVGLQFHYFQYSKDLFGVNATGTAVKLVKK